MQLRQIIILLIVFFCINSCKKDPVATHIDLGYDYFPIKVGSWIVYDVDSMVIDFLAGELSFQYQVKQVVESIQQDAGGRDVYRIERYFRENETDNWRLADVWKWYKDNRIVEVFEENTWYVKLIFPVVLSDTTTSGQTKEDPDNLNFWDGNAKNDFGQQLYGYRPIHHAHTVFNHAFDSVVTVVHSNRKNVIKTEHRVERYAKHIGLIEKEIIVLNHPPQKDTTGTYFKMTLNSFGVN